MTTVLGVDTAGKNCSVAVLQDGRLVYECSRSTGLSHSEELLPMVDSALKAAGVTMADLSVLGVTAGPGSFTGLRIGLALVKGLALPFDTPCVGVSTLEALAAGCVGTGTVVCALDARRNQVYRAAFDLETHARLLEDDAAGVDSLREFCESCKKPLIFVGDGAYLCYNRFGQLPGVLPVPPALGQSRGVGVALTAAAAFENGTAVPASALLPSYHRLSQAERERAERMNTKE